MKKKRIRASLFGVKALSYANVEDIPGNILDLGEGDNPYGLESSLFAGVDLMKPALWASYPHSLPGIKEDLIRWWSDTCPLSSENLFLTAGSIDAIYKIHALFDPAKGRALGIAPQFSEAAAHAQAMGFSLQALCLREEEGFRIPVEALCENLTPEVSYVHLEHPHNPTGQALSLPDLQRILDKAVSTGSYVVVDEAYGDYLPRGASAAVFLPAYDNLIVIRSFSKGFGLAGARAGYLLAHKALQEPLLQLTNPFVIAGPTGILLHRLLQADEEITAVRQKIAGTKQRLRARIGRRLHMGKTEDTVPIGLLYTEGKEDLERAFWQEGIRVVSGLHYPGLHRHCVRVRMPKEEDEARFFRVVDGLKNR